MRMMVCKRCSKSVRKWWNNEWLVRNMKVASYRISKYDDDMRIDNIIHNRLKPLINWEYNKDRDVMIDELISE